MRQIERAKQVKRDLKEDRARKLRLRVVKAKLAARTVQRYWWRFVARENKVAQILGESPKFIQREAKLELENQTTTKINRKNQPRTGKSETLSTQNAEKTVVLGERPPTNEKTFVVKTGIDLAFVDELRSRLVNSRVSPCTLATTTFKIPSMDGALTLNVSERVFCRSLPQTALSLGVSTQLRELQLASVSLKSFGADLPNVERIDLSHNRLSTLRGLNAPRAKVLNLRDNRIARAEFNPMPHLAHLSLGGNQLISVDCLSNSCPRLVFLDISGYGSPFTETFLLKHQRLRGGEK